MKRLILISALGLVGCGSANEDTKSEFSFLTFGTSGVLQSTMADATNSEVKICLEGSVTDADYERALHWSKRAALTWMRVLASIDTRVTAKITFTCSSYDLKVVLRNGSGTSFARPGWTTIYTSRPYGTWTHEFGHALAALGDTYAGGAGRCKSGHPQSLMCWGAYGPRKDPDQYSTLWQDDIDGITANHRKIQKDFSAPSWAESVDLTAPLDVENPWPGANTKVEVVDSNLRIVNRSELQIDRGPVIDL